MKYLLSFLIIGLSLATSAQKPEKINLKDKHYCNAHHTDKLGEVDLFEPSKDAKELLDTIALATGLDQGSVILKAAFVPTALAVLDGKKRYILINELDISNVEEDIDSRWKLYFIIAHELAHHALGHTLDDEGSRYSYELKADEFGGFALAKLGATLNQAVDAIKDFEDYDDSETHPPLSARKIQIAVGWKNGKRGIKPQREDKTIEETETEEDNFKNCSNKGKISVKNHTEKAYYVIVEANFNQNNPDRPNTWGRKTRKEAVINPGKEALIGIFPAGTYSYFISYYNGWGYEQSPYMNNSVNLEECNNITIHIE